MKQEKPFQDTLQSNIQLLTTFWNRHYFHDMRIDSIIRVRGRVVILLDEYALVMLHVNRFDTSSSEFPTVWISHQLEHSADIATLSIETQDGNTQIQFRNLRLFGRQDFTAFIPPIDPK
jgi:hypothetical protein